MDREYRKEGGGKETEKANCRIKRRRKVGEGKEKGGK